MNANKNQKVIQVKVKRQQRKAQTVWLICPYCKERGCDECGGYGGAWVSA